MKYLFLIIFASLQIGCALRVYDNGKLAIADYGDTSGTMHYKSRTARFDWTGTRNVSNPTTALGSAVSKGIISAGASATVIP